jgi:hypothetical protein
MATTGTTWNVTRRGSVEVGQPPSAVVITIGPTIGSRTTTDTT